ncbi:GDP-L-fucose synthetase [hydrothermal vent metagenome]|uniref:GDP-L-fucose synthase n=1 Tax=hydrothermal vent metagenome TaxID=652676 RepID=A0A3B1A6U8_9ZZZZ
MRNSRIDSSSPIYVAGHNGLVGSAIVRQLEKKGYRNIVTATRSEVDLLNQTSVNTFLAKTKPDYIYVAAAKVGGIYANSTFPATFLYENLMIECNLINGAYLAGVNNLLFLGSSCIYPRECSQPMKESYLLTGELEPTNEPYAIAKIAGIKLCESYNKQYGTRYVSAMPTNLFGINDNFNLENSHVLPAMIRKAHEAKLKGENALPLWGSGSPLREFLYVDDMADACLFLMENGVEEGLFNVGVGKDISIKELALLVCNVVGFSGRLEFDPSKPDGTPRKLMNVDRMTTLGWQAKTSLRQGIENTYEWFLRNQHVFRN